MSSGTGKDAHQLQCMWRCSEWRPTLGTCFCHSVPRGRAGEPTKAHAPCLAHCTRRSAYCANHRAPRLTPWAPALQAARACTRRPNPGTNKPRRPSTVPPHRRKEHPILHHAAVPTKTLHLQKLLKLIPSLLKQLQQPLQQLQQRRCNSFSRAETLPTTAEEPAQVAPEAAPAIAEVASIASFSSCGSCFSNNFQ